MNLVVQSPAKINWTLAVLGKRPDGYHELESLVCPVTLYDELRFEPRASEGFSLSCDDATLPTDDRNLIVRAARLLSESLRSDAPERRLPGVHCTLSKTIPVGGGLGGGSSNAATTLTALRTIWQPDWPADQLHGLAAQLGSDVPLFVYGGPVIIRGRGERIEPVKLRWNGWIVLILPGVPVSTAEVYHTWRADAPRERAPMTAAQVVQEFTAHSSGLPAVRRMELAYNDLEGPALRVCPSLAAIRDRCAELAARPVRLSGSGSTLFTAFDTQAEAEAFAESARKRVEVGTKIVRWLNQDGPPHL